MHTIKVALELLLTLAVMRAISWGIGWGLWRLLQTAPLTGAGVANAASLAIFIGFLVWNLFPGEPFDYAATVFGVVVYAACFLMDLKWRPWRAQRGTQSNPA